MQDGQFLLKLTLEMTIYFRQFSTDQDDTMTRHDCRPWFICVLNKKISRSIPSYQTRVHMYLTSGENVKTDNFQSVPESTTDRDETLTRHDFRPWFMRV